MSNLIPRFKKAKLFNLNSYCTPWKEENKPKEKYTKPFPNKYCKYEKSSHYLDLYDESRGVIQNWDSEKSSDKTFLSIIVVDMDHHHYYVLYNEAYYIGEEQVVGDKELFDKILTNLKIDILAPTETAFYIPLTSQKMYDSVIKKLECSAFCIRKTN